MNIKVELLKDHIASYVNEHIQIFEIDADEITDSTSIRILAKIQSIIKDEKYSDFDVVEEIVSIFEAYGIGTGGRHDF